MQAIGRETQRGPDGAGLKIIAAIRERPVIERILTHLDLDPDPQPSSSSSWVASRITRVVAVLVPPVALLIPGGARALYRWRVTSRIYCW